MAEPPLGSDLEPDRLIGERIAGRFVVERLIGHGQLSTAFSATDDRLHRRVTVKLFHPRHRDDVQVVESQLATARSVARLSHEHIAMVIDRGEHEGMPLIVLEHVRGENLQERIDRFAPLAVGEVAGYALQIARALAYAHGHGVVHGNLRPGNVLLSEEREVKLVDFGGGSYVAQLVGDPYAAPELREVDADAPAEPTDDIYALGALIFVALTEQAPVPDLDPGELQLLRPDVTMRLASTVARALAADPQDRYLSMREFAAELAALREAMAPVAGGIGDAAAGRPYGAGQETRAFTTAEMEELDEHTAEEDAEGVGATRVTRAPRPPRERRERTPNETRARLLAWSMVVAPLAALVIFGVMIAGERSNDQVRGTPGAGAGPTVPAKITGAVSFDPEPAGDGEEHAAEVANAVDGDPETTWETEGYDTRDFNGGAKPGVGIVLQLAEEADVRDVAITTRLLGWKVEVRAADEPSSTLDGWKRVSQITPVEDNRKIAVDLDGHKTKHLLLWITGLAIDPDESNRSRARIGDITVYVADKSRSAT
jgi:serine/threonine-protein kinase